jgi:plasmid stabilization system protein ParE
MTVVFTAPARAKLDNILAYTKRSYPIQLAKLEAQIRDVTARVERFPQNAKVFSQRPGVRIVPFIRYPFLIFYREIDGAIETLHVYHVAREAWE